MSLFGLDPESVAARLKSGEPAPRLPSLASSIGLGSAGFAVIALVVFGVWAWGGRWLTARVGELGLYAICCVLFIGGGGWWFSRLVVGLGSLRRFCGLFAIAFFLYAAGWTAAWLVLRNRGGEWLGSLAGTVLLGCVFATAFGSVRALAKVILVLFVTHSVGYLLGSALYSAVPGLAGQLLWGVAYGLGFGAGIGWALHLCQEPVRRILEARPNHEVLVRGLLLSTKAGKPHDAAKSRPHSNGRGSRGRGFRAGLVSDSRTDLRGQVGRSVVQAVSRLVHGVLGGARRGG